MSTAATKTLPDKPSELIRVALADLRKCEAMPEVYDIDMSTWHERIGDLCHVCLAGATLAQTVGAPPHGTFHDAMNVILDDADREDVNRKVDALNEFRKGTVMDGLDRLGLNASFDNRDHPFYRQDPEGFHVALHKLADDLEAAGL